MFFEERNCNSSNAMAQPLNFSRNFPDLSFMRCLLPPNDSVLGAQTRELAANLFLSLSAGAATAPGSTLAPNRLLEPSKSQHSPPVSVLPTFVPPGGDPAYSLPHFFPPYDRRAAPSEVDNTQAAYEQAFLPKAVDRTQRQPYADYHLAAFQRALDHLALLGLSNNRQSPCSVNSMLSSSCPSTTHARMDISLQKTQGPLTNSLNVSQSVPACQVSTDSNVIITSSNQNECHRTQRVFEERRSRVIIHQIGGAEDHFSKSLQDLQARNMTRSSDKNGWRSRGDSKNLRNPSSFRSSIWTVAPEETQTDSEKIQNIADLAVEKHFEKALANFRTTDQQTPKSPLDLSCHADSIIDIVSSPSQTDVVEVREGHSVGQGRSPVRPAILSSAARSFESGISGSEASNSSPGSGCSYKPKKNWLAQYGWRKQGVSADFPSCLSCDSSEWYLESGSSDKSAESLKDVRLTRMDSRKSHKPADAFRTQTAKEGFGKIGYMKRTSSVPCLTSETFCLSPEAFQLNSSLIEAGGRNSILSIIPCSSASSSPNNAEQKLSFFSESSSDDEAPGISITNTSERTTTMAKSSCLRHQSVAHVRRQNVVRRRSETIKSDSSDCLLHREPPSALTPEVSPTATSGFFTDSSFSLELTLPTVSEDNFSTTTGEANRSEQRPSLPTNCQRHHQRVNAQTYASKYWTIRKRAASDAHSWSCLKRSRSLAVDKTAREIPDRVDTDELRNPHYVDSQSEVAKIAIP